MRFVLQAIKWAVTVFMVLLLIIGMIDLIALKIDKNAWAISARNLQWVEVTIKSEAVTPDGIVLTTEDYAKRFMIPVAPVSDDLAAALSAGTSVRILISRNIFQFDTTPVYEVNDLDGRTLINLTRIIVPADRVIEGWVLRVLYGMIDIPLIYFFCLAVVPYIWRNGMYAPQARPVRYRSLKNAR